VAQLDSKELFARVSGDAAKGDIQAQFELLRYIAFGQGIGNLSDYSHLVSDDLLGLERVSFEEDVKRIVEGIKKA